MLPTPRTPSPWSEPEPAAGALVVAADVHCAPRC